MSRCIVIVALYAGFIVSGCKGETPSSPSTGLVPAAGSPVTGQATTASAPAEVVANQSADPAETSSGIWSEAQIESYLTNELKLASVTLTPAGADGHFIGMGETESGEELSLHISPENGGLICNYSDNAGGGGRLSFAGAEDKASNDAP